MVLLHRIAGPVGAGKTALIEKLTREMADKYSVAVITNDIYTQEDALMNLEAVDEMAKTLSGCEIIFIESGDGIICRRPLARI